MGGRTDGLGELQRYATEDIPTVGKVVKFSARSHVAGDVFRKDNSIRDIHPTLLDWQLCAQRTHN